MSVGAVTSRPGGRAAAARPLLVTGALVLIVMSMVLPIPASFLDAGIALSIATATLILVMASLVDKPTDFQAFPVLLLVSLFMRLSLNVSSTRLILTQGHTGPDAAGDVISGFSEFVAGGSLLVGVTVFAVISVVNFMVITKGSGRMAEVAARFALDSLPGKQLAIDADLNAGSIDHEEAKARRVRDQREISFFGSLDGASKFVKGDAVAGILITLINLFIGLAVGLLAHGLPLSEALTTYSHLTIGDGLVSQIPALITSMAAALLLSRGGATDTTADLISQQLLSNWRVPAIVAAGMVILSLVPGMPKLLFLSIAATLGFLAWRTRRRAAQPEPAEQTSPAERGPAPAPRIGDMLDMDEIAVEIGPDLVMAALDEGRGLGARILNLRSHFARSYGLILPEVRITDAAGLSGADYQIKLHGVIRGRGTLRAFGALALGDDAGVSGLVGERVKEPVYGSPAVWIGVEDQDHAAIMGATVVTPMEVLSTHLMEVVKSNLSALMTMSAMQKLIAELKNLSDTARAEANQRYFDAMIPDKVAPELLLAVLRALLDERISIRNLPLILDAVHEFRAATQPDAVYELVRKRLRGQITEALGRDGEIGILQLHPVWETEFTRAEAEMSRGGAGPMSPVIARRVTEAVRQALTSARFEREPVLAVPDHRRRLIRAMLGQAGVAVTVLGFDEIDPAARVRLAGTVEAA
ncbi:flagellar biosynthesis protein FlhA [Paracoccus pacificus]|uniref:Flagellar biosynthesis protein FlhA n=1 Tax=Paracoccus pacificus TaxID=1463598 RepID=A0ABW4RCD9_9RHOB